MSLRNMAVYDGITTEPVFAGDALALVGSPTVIQNGFQLMCSTDLNFRTRRSLTIKSRPPAYNPKTKTWTKQKSTASFTIPEVGTDGEIMYNTFRFEFEIHPAASDGVANALQGAAQSILADVNFRNYLKTGSLD